MNVKAGNGYINCEGILLPSSVSTTKGVTSRIFNPYCRLDLILFAMKKTQAIRLVEQAGISFKCMSYTYDPENLDVRKIAAENNLDIQEIYKTLVLKGNRSGLLVAVIPGHHRLIRKEMARLSANKKVSLLPIADLEKHTGYIRGGCCPIGMKTNFPVWIDSAAIQLGAIWVNAGHRGLFIRLQVGDLVRMTSGQVETISEMA